jgi:transglutaminase-like putative cysteine protease
MKLHATAHLAFHANAEVPAIFMLKPRSGQGQWVTSEEYELDPEIRMIEYTDGFGNLCQRATIPFGPFSITASCVVDSPDEIDVDPTAEFVPIALIPDPLLQFLLPSRYCQADFLGNLATSITGHLTPGYQQVEAIRAWIRREVRYEYGTSNASTSALETANDKVGVCRDLAHLGIALCRAINIPARMVVGYLHELKPMDLHAWFEAYVGQRWYVFDATQEHPMGNRITIAYGRDAADVALITQFGPMDLLDMWVNVEPAP